VVELPADIELIEDVVEALVKPVKVK